MSINSTATVSNIADLKKSAMENEGLPLAPSLGNEESMSYIAPCLKGKIRDPNVFALKKECEFLISPGINCLLECQEGLSFCSRHSSYTKLNSKIKKPKEPKETTECCHINKSGTECKLPADKNSTLCKMHLDQSKPKVTILKCSFISKKGVECKLDSQSGKSLCTMHEFQTEKSKKTPLSCMPQWNICKSLNSNFTECGQICLPNKVRCEIHDIENIKNVTVDLLSESNFTLSNTLMKDLIRELSLSNAIHAALLQQQKGNTPDVPKVIKKPHITKEIPDEERCKTVNKSGTRCRLVRDKDCDFCKMHFHQNSIKSQVPKPVEKIRMDPSDPGYSEIMKRYNEIQVKKESSETDFLQMLPSQVSKSVEEEKKTEPYRLVVDPFISKHP